MTRALLILRSEDIRKRAHEWVSKAPDDTRLEFKAPKRTLDQNAKLWASLTDVASQKEHFGRKYSADIWKLIFLNALDRETKFVPSLDGSTVVPIGHSSSDLSKEEMSELIELIQARGAEWGVVFHAPEPRK